MLLLQSISSIEGVGDTSRLDSWQKGRRRKYSTSTYLMAQEVVIFHTETHVGTAVEVVSAVKWQLPKTNLGRDTRKPFLLHSCFKHIQGPEFSSVLCFPRKCHPSISSAQCWTSEMLWTQISMPGNEELALLIRDTPDTSYSCLLSWLFIHLWKVFLWHLTRQITRWRWSLLHAVGIISILELRTSLLLGICNNI